MYHIIDRSLEPLSEGPVCQTPGFGDLEIYQYCCVHHRDFEAAHSVLPPDREVVRGALVIALQRGGGGIAPGGGSNGGGEAVITLQRGGGEIAPRGRQ